MTETIDIRRARRLAIVRAGLAKPRWTGLPRAAKGRGSRARRSALEIVRHFGYLQLDTISVAGARSHTLVLLSRLRGMDPELGEDLLKPSQPLFEYWGHEACWLPLDLYPLFGFRRRDFRAHWWSELLDEHRSTADALLERIRTEGPLRSVDLEGERSSAGMWELKLSRKLAHVLWCRGEIAIRQRKNFQILYDLTERVIPREHLDREVSVHDSVKALLLLAAAGHGWASRGTLAATWRLRNMAGEIRRALAELEEDGKLVACDLVGPERCIAGWIRPADLETTHRLRHFSSADAEGMLLSPFDPLLWDRPRVQTLFGFHQVLEIYKPAEERRYGYYCLPILVGEHLVGRCDLKAHRRDSRLEVRSLRWEDGAPPRRRDRGAAAMSRFAESMGLELDLASSESAPSSSGT